MRSGTLSTSSTKWPRAAALLDPAAYNLAADAGDAWRAALSCSHRTYVELSNHLAKKAAASGLSGTEARKFARQAARSVLPNATETKIFVTMNARSARHFVEMRGSRHADPEIRVLALGVLSLLRDEAPALFGDYDVVPLADGTREAITPHRKV